MRGAAQVIVIAAAALAGAAIVSWLRPDLRGELVAARASLDRLEGELADRDANIDSLRQRITRLEAEAARMQVPERVVVDQSSTARQAPSPAPASTPATTAELAALACLRNLLPDRFADATPAALYALTELDLRGTAVIDADLASLASLPNLKSLSLRGTAVTDFGLHHLAACHNLEVVELRGTAVTGIGLGSLPSRLKHVDLTDSKTGASGFHSLSSLPSLATLKLNRLPVTDADLEVVARWPSLQHLEIDGTAVTEAGVGRVLELLPSLRRIEVRGLVMSDRLAGLLQGRYPYVELVVEHGRGPHGR